MSRHEGVSCDSCLKGNFKGKRYKCLICYDYDLCSTCYEAGATTTRHSTDHPMQCILTRLDYDLYYGGEALPLDQTHSFTCPHCGQMGFTEATLQEHVSSEHSDASTDVVCPVCATMPGGEPNHVTDDLVSHLSIEHRNSRDMEEATSARHVRRIPHPGGRGGGGMSRARAHLSQMQFTAPGIGLSSPSNRDSAMDPIAELLSQLSGVRRAANLAQTSTTSQLQQLQMQLQMERQQVQTARQQLERLPRRNLISNNNNSLNTGGGAGSSSLVAGGGGGVLPAQFQFGSTANPSTSTQSAVPLPPPPSKSTSQFLLSKYIEPTLSESEQNAIDIERADRSMFVQELILSSLMDPLSLDEIINYGETSGSADSTNSETLLEENPGKKNRAIVSKSQPTSQESKVKQSSNRSSHLKLLPVNSHSSEALASNLQKHQKRKKSVDDNKTPDPPAPPRKQ